MNQFSFRALTPLDPPYSTLLAFVVVVIQRKKAVPNISLRSPLHSSFPFVSSSSSAASGGAQNEILPLADPP